ncbi:MAG: hypothetical protein KatS3mg087_1065 [Patescibacteria group bacterium]|nr:MAG: hypothetical protein KatS3mg087_1065 [Patescibacteria group bacterium]
MFIARIAPLKVDLELQMLIVQDDPIGEDLWKVLCCFREFVYCKCYRLSRSDWDKHNLASSVCYDKVTYQQVQDISDKISKMVSKYLIAFVTYSSEGVTADHETFLYDKQHSDEYVSEFHVPLNYVNKGWCPYCVALTVAEHQKWRD